MEERSDLRKRTYLFSLEMISFCRTLPNERIYWSINDQLFRAATSVGANIIEAKASSSRKDFIRFYDIALKSGNEAIYWLSLLRDGELQTDKDRVEKLLSELAEICKMLGKSLITLKEKSSDI